MIRPVKKYLSFGIMLTATVLLAVNTMSAQASALDDPGSRVAPGGAGGGTGLVPVVPEVDAGDVTIGATGQVVLRFRNDGSKDVQISQVDLYPSSTVTAIVSLDECSKTPLGAGAECAIVVTVKGVKTGTWRVEALLRHDGRSRITTGAMRGNVSTSESGSDETLTSSDVEAIPNEIDFGSMDSGRPLVKSVILRNVTSEPIEITNVEASPESNGYSVKSTCKKLAGGEACAVAITWSPSAKGQSDGILLVEHTGSTKVVTVELTGDYSPEDMEAATIFPQSVAGMGLMVSSQEELDFGTVSNEASITTSLVNVGDTDLKISDIELGGVENGLRVSKNGCKIGTVLRPVEACPLTLTWAAVREGAIIDDVQIHHDGARGVLVLPVRGDASVAVNRDTKAVIVESSSPNQEVYTARPADKSQALEGFIITSLSGKKAIINGPGGSRVVNKNQQLVLGGIQWIVDVTSEGVDFISGKDRVRLLFDRSLSSVNRATPQSSSSSGSSSTGTSTGSTTNTSQSSSSNTSPASTTAPSTN